MGKLLIWDKVRLREPKYNWWVFNEIDRKKWLVITWISHRDKWLHYNWWAHYYECNNIKSFFLEDNFIK